MGFEQVLLSSLVFNPEFCKRTLHFIKDEYFSDLAERLIFQTTKNYVTQYNVVPTKEALAIIINDSNTQEHIHNQTMSILGELDYNEQNSVDWLMDKSEEWCQERAMYNAMCKAIGIMDGSDKSLSKSAIPSILQDAIATSFDSSVGHNYFTDAEAQYEYYHDDTARIPFKQNIFNRITRGGVKKKTLNVILAGINVGKSTTLIDLTAHYLEAGLNVLYLSMEMTENVVRSRVDVRLMGLKSEEIESLSKHQYLSNVNGIREKTRGEFVVKDFPSGSAHVGHFRHTISELKIKQGFIPDVIVVDYLGITASSKLPASMKANSDTYLGAVATELRALAHECGVPLWTAQQVTRGKQESDDAALGDTAGSITIAATADLMIFLAVPEALIDMKQAVGKVMKNRYANRNNIRKFIIGLDNDYQCLTDVTEATQSQIMDENELKQFNSKETTKSNDVSEWKFD